MKSYLFKKVDFSNFIFNFSFIIKDKNYLDISFDVLLNEKKLSYPNFEKYKNELEYREKAIISRLTKLMTKILFASKAELESAIQICNLTADYHKYLIHIWDKYNFHRTLNNYSLIKFHFDKTQAFYKDETYILENKRSDVDKELIKNIGSFAKLDWKIEVTLSSIWMKKVKNS